MGKKKSERQPSKAKGKAPNLEILFNYELICVKIQIMTFGWKMMVA